MELCKNHVRHTLKNYVIHNGMKFNIFSFSFSFTFAVWCHQQSIIWQHPGRCFCPWFRVLRLSSILFCTAGSDSLYSFCSLASHTAQNLILDHSAFTLCWAFIKVSPVTEERSEMWITETKMEEKMAQMGTGGIGSHKWTSSSHWQILVFVILLNVTCLWRHFCTEQL